MSIYTCTKHNRTLPAHSAGYPNVTIDQCPDCASEVASLRAVNAALLAACEHLMTELEDRMDIRVQYHQEMDEVAAAIAKANGSNEQPNPTRRTE